tara:strand:+ start:947 stop:1432 length:486 start_codon:yes stop_codon:yes gene_type:complete
LKILFIPTIIVFLDQLSKTFIKKYWVDNNLFYSKINFLGDYIRIIFIENPGIAFGIDTSKYHFFITILTVVAVVFLSTYLYSLIIKNDFEKIPMSFILGGAMGNLIDRVLVLFPYFDYNGVIDFIDIGFGHYRWYTFNIADAAITVGLVIFLYQSFILKKS